jgi:hypothetical protein
MASPEPPPGEVIISIRVPCREGKERVWQAIELLQHTQQSPQPVPIPPAHPFGQKTLMRYFPRAYDPPITRSFSCITP